MTAKLHRVVFEHHEHEDFRLMASSLDQPDEIKWQRRLRNRIRLSYRDNRPESTVYWRDEHNAAVIRRLPGGRGDGRDDVAHVLVGTTETLDVPRALSLPGWPGWRDPLWDWERSGLRPIAVAELPAVAPELSEDESACVDEDLLWPMIHALMYRYDEKVSVYQDLAEHDTVLLIRAFVDMAAVLKPNDPGAWTFSTRGSNESVIGDLAPRLQFVPETQDFSTVVPRRSVVKYPYGYGSQEEHDNCRILVRTYLRHGRDGLVDMLAGVWPAEDVRAPAPPVETVPGPMDEPTTPIEQGPPTVEERNPADEWELMRHMVDTPLDELPALVEKMRHVPLSTGEDRATIRRTFLGPEGLVNRRFAEHRNATERVDMACALADRFVRGPEWSDPGVRQVLDRTIETAPGSLAAHALVITAIRNNAMAGYSRHDVSPVWPIVLGDAARHRATHQIPPPEKPVTTRAEPVPAGPPTDGAVRSAQGKGNERLSMALFVSCATVALLVIVVIELAVALHG